MNLLNYISNLTAINLSELVFKEIDNDGYDKSDYVAISIVTGLSDRYKLQSNWYDSIQLVFDDSTVESEYNNCISNSQAIDLYKFIIKNSSKKFIVHCAAGKSRSGAVVKFILEYTRPHNKLVFNKLIEACAYNEN